MTTIQVLSTQIKSGRLNPHKIAGDAIAEAIAQEFVIEWDEAEAIASEALRVGRDWPTVREELRSLLEQFVVSGC